MGRFCLTKWNRFSKILTMIDRNPFKVRYFEGGNPWENLRYLVKKSISSMKIFREADSWEKSRTWLLVSKPRRNHKCECIRVNWSQASKIETFHNCIFSLITIEEMKRLTSSEDCLELKEDSLYLPWTMMKWNLVGEIREYYVEKSDLCTDNSVSVFFPSKGFRQKYSRGVKWSRKTP